MSTLNNIILTEKLPESKINEDELYRQVYVYSVDKNVAYMMAVIEHDGLARAYNMDMSIMEASSIKSKKSLNPQKIMMLSFGGQTYQP